MTTANPVNIINFTENSSKGTTEDDRCMFVGQNPPLVKQVWFTARLPGCVIGIKVECEVSQAEPDFIELALALGKEEQLVQYIEQWLNIELDFIPADQKPINPISLELIVPNEMVEKSPAGQRPPSVELSLPVHLLVENSVPDWKDLIVNWSDCSCEILLSEFTASAAEIDSLSSGALVLVENSFLDTWQVCIRVSFDEQEHKLSLYSYAALDNCTQQLTLAAFELSDNKLGVARHLNIDTQLDNQASDTQNTISCVVKTRLSVDLLLGVVPANSRLSKNEQRSRHLNIGQWLVSVQLNGEQVGEGRLVNIGDGYSVLLN